MVDKRRTIMGAILIALCTVCPAAGDAADAPETPGRIMHLVTESGLPILTTGLPMHEGDRFIDSNNKEWEVNRVDGSRAVGRQLGTVGLKLNKRERQLVGNHWRTTRADLLGGEPTDVVIYHSHSDESYTPGDGTDSIDGQGGIYRVGASLVGRLNELGLKAIQRPENHNPHDAGSYVRSRRTALDAVAGQQPTVLFDVHRDAGPRSEYDFTVAEAPVSHALIVIGGSNPAHEGNLAFAKLLKDQSDSLNPGLVKGIYVGRGNYNQDISTRNILLEFGTQETPRAEAERGAALIAAAIAPLVREVQRPNSPATQVENRAAWHNVGWVSAVVLLLVTGAFVVNSGGWQPAYHRLMGWGKRLFGRLKRR